MEDFDPLKMLLCKNIPCYIFWKDRNLTYQGGNEQFLKAIGLTSVEDLKGRTDYDFPWASDAKSYKDSDLLILEGNSVLSSKELRWQVNGPLQIIVNKLPLKNEKDQIIGILGLHHIASGLIIDPSISQTTPAFPPAAELAQSSEIELFSMLKNISNVILTHREIECLSLWLSGYSIKESAYCLKISQKSIEAYRKHIKDKMGVYHRYQLIDLMQAKGVFHLFLSLAKIIQQKAKQAGN